MTTGFGKTATCHRHTKAMITANIINADSTQDAALLRHRTGNESASDTIKPIVLLKGRNTAQTYLTPCFLIKTPVSTF
ncbi:hypothetical protein [Corynebacterium stationis]|nr:hypothetical protein [Corynebacterium stationis]